MSPLRIVQVTPFFGYRQYGGTERFVMNLSEELADRGHHIDVFSTKHSTEIPYQEYYKNLTIHRFYSPVNVFGINPACIMLHKLLKVKEIDVFHVHSYIYFTSIQVALAKLFKRIPILLHIHGGVGRPPYKTSMLRHFAKLFYDQTFGSFVLHQSDIIASVSSYDAEILKNSAPKKRDSIFIINNAINVENFPEVTPSVQGDFVVSYIGDLEPWKGVVYYARVIKEVLKKNYKVVFWFIGNGSLSSSLQDFFEGQQRVRFFGTVDHKTIPSLLSKTNLLVHPSYWEGSPTTIIEAMSMGIPIIGSKVGDIPRLLKYGKAGTLFVAGNEIQLREKIEEAITNYDEILSTAQKYRKGFREDFSLKVVTDKIEKFYYKLSTKEN